MMPSLPSEPAGPLTFGFDDPAQPKRFTADVRLAIRRDERESQRVVSRTVVACTWHEAEDELSRLPWEDLCADEEELTGVEIEMTDWVNAS
jgi:hypothetical protein